MDEKGTGWTRLDASGRAVPNPCNVWGFLVRTGAATEEVAVYDGQYVGSGRLFAKLYCTLDGLTSILFTKPVHFDSGVYVDFVGNIDEVTVLWEPYS